MHPTRKHAANPAPRLGARAALLCALFVLGCSGGVTTALDGGADLALAPLTPAQSKIEHLLVIVQENHTFDSYFARYCTAPPGSAPACTEGPSCCEAGPDKDPGTGLAAAVLDDAEHRAFDPDHTQACEQRELNHGKMDGYITAAGCGNARNFAYAVAPILAPYWALAATGSLADHDFQPMVGASSGNDMYLVRARYVFTDNEVDPASLGEECAIAAPKQSFTDPTIADLLAARGASYAWYIGGYEAMAKARAMAHCPEAPDACGFGVGLSPCIYDPADVPTSYYPSTRDNPAYMRDLADLDADLATGRLPQVAFVKEVGYLSEHPGYQTSISDGIHEVERLLAALAASPLAARTLVLLTYDEGGGYFDHIAPPPTSTVDNQPYGTRIPLLALGPFARRNHISHALLEHSSIVRFIEWNWLDGKTGQLAGRDAVVANLGSLLDPAATGIAVPE